jgi:tetratricopeptide (TPR) repeat protein
MRGDEAGARACFAAVITRCPGEAAPHFNLGVMALDSDPQAALDHFTRGESLAPDDVDYSLGRARALVRLGRAEEARQALARARDLDPEHPRIAELESSLS